MPARTSAASAEIRRAPAKIAQKILYYIMYNIILYYIISYNVLPARTSAASAEIQRPKYSPPATCIFMCRIHVINRYYYYYYYYY